jgi:hypothetical protein
LAPPSFVLDVVEQQRHDERFLGRQMATQVLAEAVARGDVALCSERRRRYSARFGGALRRGP